jgi:acetyl esterase/lipase
MWAVPKTASQKHVLLAIHGGGYCGGSMYSHRKLYGHFAKSIGCKALIIDYRLAPEHMFPAAIDDAVTAYQWLLDQDIAPKQIVVAGDSAGGGIAVALQLCLKDNRMPLPAASLLLSPWFDFEGTGESTLRNAGKDVLVTPQIMKNNLNTYLGPQGDPHHPYANPLYGDFTGLPPMYFQAGSEELIADDSTRGAEKCRKAGIEAKLEIYPEMQHVFHFMAGYAPEADRAIADMAKWARPKLGLA